MRTYVQPKRPRTFSLSPSPFIHFHPLRPSLCSQFFCYFSSFVACCLSALSLAISCCVSRLLPFLFVSVPRHVLCTHMLISLCYYSIFLLLSLYHSLFSSIHSLSISHAIALVFFLFFLSAVSVPSLCHLSRLSLSLPSLSLLPHPFLSSSSHLPYLLLFMLDLFSYISLSGFSFDVFDSFFHLLMTCLSSGSSSMPDGLYPHFLF